MELPFFLLQVSPLTDSNDADASARPFSTLRGLLRTSGASHGAVRQPDHERVRDQPATQRNFHEILPSSLFVVSFSLSVELKLVLSMIAMY